MTSMINGFYSGSTQAKTDPGIELKEIKTRLEFPSPPFAPQNKEIRATHITTKQELLAILQKLNENPELKSMFLKQLDPNDPVHHTANALLNEDLTSSTLIIQDDDKGKDWLQRKEQEFQERAENNWLVEAKPNTSFRYYHIITKPAQALWWTGKSAYKVWCVASPIIVPITTAITIMQSPAAQILFQLARKFII